MSHARVHVPTVRLQVALAAVAATVLVQNRHAIKYIPVLLQPNKGNTRKMLIGIGIIYAYEQACAKALQKLGLALPSSLISMISIFVLLNAYAAAAGDAAADAVAEYLRPAVDHLGKWMPLYLTPPLVTLPNAVADLGPCGAAMWAKLGGIHVVGWLATLSSTAAIAAAVEDACAAGGSSGGGSSGAAAKRHEEDAAPPAEQPQREQAPLDGAPPAAAAVAAAAAPSDTDSGAGDAAAAADVAEALLSEAPAEGEAAAADAAAAAAAPPAAKAAPRAKTKEEKFREAWGVITAASFVIAPFYSSSPAMFSTTVAALLKGNALPAKTKAVVHPLVTCSVVTAVVAAVLGRSEGRSTSGALAAYFTKRGIACGGAGDAFFGLLSACCCALGVRMYVSRRTLFDNAAPLLASSLLAASLSLFGTTAACGTARVTPKLTFTLAQRSVMSSLGISASQILGGNAGMAVASILLTGIYGASFGKTLLDKMGYTKDRIIPRGIATGASAHSIGTAALLEDEPDAGAISSVSLCLTGVFHTALCSIPAVQFALRKLARA